MPSKNKVDSVFVQNRLKNISGVLVTVLACPVVCGVRRTMIVHDNPGAGTSLVRLVRSLEIFFKPFEHVILHFKRLVVKRFCADADYVHASNVEAVEERVVYLKSGHSKVAFVDGKITARIAISRSYHHGHRTVRGH